MIICPEYYQDKKKNMEFALEARVTSSNACSYNIVLGLSINISSVLRILES